MLTAAPKTWLALANLMIYYSLANTKSIAVPQKIDIKFNFGAIDNTVSRRLPNICAKLDSDAMIVNIAQNKA